MLTSFYFKPTVTADFHSFDSFFFLRETATSSEWNLLLYSFYSKFCFASWITTVARGSRISDKIFVSHPELIVCSSHKSNPRPRFTYSIYDFYGATMMTKGSLYVNISMLKRISQCLRAHIPGRGSCPRSKFYILKSTSGRESTSNTGEKLTLKFLYRGP